MLAGGKMVECDGYVRWKKLEAFAEGDGAHIKGIKWQIIIDHTNRNYLKSMGTNVAFKIYKCGKCEMGIYPVGRSWHTDFSKVSDAPIKRLGVTAYVRG